MKFHLTDLSTSDSTAATVAVAVIAITAAAAVVYAVNFFLSSALLSNSIWNFIFRVHRFITRAQFFFANFDASSHSSASSSLKSFYTLLHVVLFCQFYTAFVCSECVCVGVCVPPPPSLPSRAPPPVYVNWCCVSQPIQVYFNSTVYLFGKCTSNLRTILKSKTKNRWFKARKNIEIECLAMATATCSIYKYAFVLAPIKKESKVKKQRHRWWQLVHTNKANSVQWMNKKKKIKSMRKLNVTCYKALCYIRSTNRK